VNAARSTHRGAEVGAGARLVGAAEIRVVYTFLDARFGAYSPRGVELAGRRVPGVPRHSGAAELSWRPRRAALVAVDVRSAGGWHADDENTTFERLAWALGARASWPLAVGGATIAPFLSAENLFSARASEALRANAAGGRYFEPAPPLRVLGGVALDCGGPG
jgi:iron complex outermembrane receptor protein